MPALISDVYYPQKKDEGFVAAAYTAAAAASDVAAAVAVGAVAVAAAISGVVAPCAVLCCGTCSFQAKALALARLLLL